MELRARSGSVSYSDDRSVGNFTAYSLDSKPASKWKEVLDLLSDSETVFYIDKYTETSGRSPTVSQSVGRTLPGGARARFAAAAIVTMPSYVGYSYNFGMSRGDCL